MQRYGGKDRPINQVTELEGLGDLLLQPHDQERDQQEEKILQKLIPLR